MSWFETHKRSLPFRDCKNPYFIWISEVMLQQTQVKTMIPYFERWIQTFPSVEALAKAPIEQVIKLWEGLGYYSRARNLHKAAKQIMEQHAGVIPQQKKALATLAGIGPYTQAAILNFAFQQRAVLIDGNVKRVAARYFGIEKTFQSLKEHRELEKHLETLLPYEQPWIFNEALMELGALVCTPQNPKCNQCPFQRSCYANQHELQASLPKKAKRKKTVSLTHAVFVCQFEDHFLVKKQTSPLMRDLYEFPAAETTDLPKTLKHPQFLNWERQSHAWKALLPVRHSFTNHRLLLLPFHLQINQRLNHLQFEWLDINSLKEKAFSAGHRKIFAQLNF